MRWITYGSAADDVTDAVNAVGIAITPLVEDAGSNPSQRLRTASIEQKRLIVHVIACPVVTGDLTICVDGGGPALLEAPKYAEVRHDSVVVKKSVLTGADIRRANDLSAVVDGVCRRAQVTRQRTQIGQAEGELPIRTRPESENAQNKPETIEPRHTISFAVR